MPCLLVGFNLFLVISTQGSNSEELSVTTGNLPDSVSPGSRTLTRGMEMCASK